MGSSTERVGVPRYEPTFGGTQPPNRPREATPDRALRLLVALLVQWSRDRLVWLAVGAAVTIGGLSFALPKRFQAEALIFPQVAPVASGSFATLAARFGLGTFSGGLSLDFYGDVLTSRGVLDSLLLRRYVGLDTQVDLLDHLGYQQGMDAERLEKGAKHLRRLVSLSADQAAGLIVLRATASSPALAAEILDSLLSVSNRAVTTALIKQASFQRQYLETRLSEAQQELRQTEGAMERFYIENRSWQQSPTLTLREGGLRREVDIARELYVTIRQEYEQARLSEARDVPTLSFINAPALPSKASSPRPLRNAVLSAFAVLSLGLAVRLILSAQRVSPLARSSEQPNRI